jgi:hypothetical protein
VVPWPERTQNPSEFTGRWRITGMEMWDTDYIDLEVKAFIEFEPDRMGHLHFGLVWGLYGLGGGPRSSFRTWAHDSMK